MTGVQPDIPYIARNPSFDRRVVNRYPSVVLRRDGRVVEGAPLLREYRLKKLIEGSNPSLSASECCNTLILNKI